MESKSKPPKKIGRPRVHAHAMTNAERQKRWRERVKADAVQLLRQLEESVKTASNPSQTLN